MPLGGGVGMQGLTIIIADDHPLFRGALKQAVQALADQQIIIEPGDFDTARHAADDHPEADLMPPDLVMPGGSVFSGLRCLRVDFPVLPFYVVSASYHGDTL